MLVFDAFGVIYIQRRFVATKHVAKCLYNATYKHLQKIAHKRSYGFEHRSHVIVQN